MSFLGFMHKMGFTLDGQGNLYISKNLYSQNQPSPYGNIYYVSKNGSDSYSGRDWAHSFLTLAAAIDVMRDRVDWSASPWAINDILYVGPGTYAEALTALPHGCMIIGAGWDTRDAQFGSKIKPAAGDPVDVGGIVNTAFLNMGFETVDGDAFDSGVINNCWFKNCRFSGPAETVTRVLLVANDCTATIWEDCVFTCGSKGVDINYADGGDKFAHCKFLNCDFTQLTTGIEISSSLVGPSSVVDRCNFLAAGQTMNNAISDGSALLDVVRCMAEATAGYTGVRSVNGSYLNGALVT